MCIHIGHEIDMWSFGCMLPELRFGGALFTGENELDQLGAIAEVLGPVPEDLVLVCNKPAYFDPDTLELVLPARKKTGKSRRVGSTPLNKLISRKKDKSFRAFVSMILAWRPEDRPLPMDAASHPWLSEAKDGDDEED
jgi:serine/threonine protein kinase